MARSARACSPPTSTATGRPFITPRAIGPPELRLGLSAALSRAVSPQASKALNWARVLINTIKLWIDHEHSKNISYNVGGWLPRTSRGHWTRVDGSRIFRGEAGGKGHLLGDGFGPRDGDAHEPNRRTQCLQ